jgi:hypothetical protein
MNLGRASRIIANSGTASSSWLADGNMFSACVIQSSASEGLMSYGEWFQPRIQIP